VNPNYDYTLSGFAVRTLLSVRAPLRRRAETFLDELAADPFQKPDFFEMAPSGRKFSVFVRNDIVITLWLDHAEKEIRVVNVEFV
jgi:hypothetical protein